MPGRIRDEDVAAVRERVRIDEVVSGYVALKRAGAGSLKGLCPFHDERTPSFHVRPAVGQWHCFGCGQGGDVIGFLRQIEGIGFVEAVERLAARAGVELRYVDGVPARSADRGQRARLVAANRAAAAFYAEQLARAPEAAPGREFLAARGFDQAAIERFGVGYAPRGGEALLGHLRRAHVVDEDAVAAGLAAQGTRGHYDRFRGRLIWPIREVSGEVVGFGARRLYDDDRVEAKYLNTPETLLYKKSQLLYGADLARREIGRRSQAVVVEGYTDVMACHLAGVETAVATCGTAFGPDHARLLRRLLLDQDDFSGEVIFTFDGDEAGQRAAQRAFDGDQRLIARTYVAVSPDGLDPCELRLRDGDAAVRDLIARRVPLYRFMLDGVLARFDLDRADNRVDAMQAAAPLAASLRNIAKADSFARELAFRLFLPEDEVLRVVRRAARSSGHAARPAGSERAGQHGAAGPAGPAGGAGSTDAGAADGGPARPQLPDPADPRLAVEREVLKLAVQQPGLLAGFDELADAHFTHPAYAAVRQAVAAAGGTGSPVAAGGGESWAAAVHDAATDDAARSLVSALAVEPLHAVAAADGHYAASLLARIREIAVGRRVAELKSKLQRTNPVDDTAVYNRMFGELVALEKQRRELREQAIGGFA